MRKEHTHTMRRRTAKKSLPPNYFDAYVKKNRKKSEAQLAVYSLLVFFSFGNFFMQLLSINTIKSSERERTEKNHDINEDFKCFKKKEKDTAYTEQ